MQIRTPKEIGLLIRDRRRQLDLTQDQLAQRIGVSRPWIVQLEQGKETAQLGMVLSVLNDLDVPLHVDPPSANRVAESRRSAVDLDNIIKNAVGPSKR